MKKKTVGAAIGRAVIFAVLVILAVSFLYPLFYMLVNSLKTLAGYYKDPFGFPREVLQIDNFRLMISQFKILKLFGNSLIVSVLSVLGVVIFGALAAFAFAKVPFKASYSIYMAILATMFIPAQVTIIPMYVAFARAHLVDSYFSVVLANWAAFLPEAIMLMTSSFKLVPDALLEAASIDGCGYYKQLLYVMMPVGWPAVSLTIIIFFINSWNDLFTPMILLKSMEKRTVIVALSSLIGRYTGDPPYQFAGLLLSAVPAIAVYVIFQRSIINGMSMGAVK